MIKVTIVCLSRHLQSSIYIYIKNRNFWSSHNFPHQHNNNNNNNNNKTFLKPELNSLPSTTILFFFFILGFIPFLSFAVLSSLCLSQFSKSLNHIPWALSHSFSGKKCQRPTGVIYCQSRYQCRYFNFCYLRFRYLDLVWFSLI